MEMLMYYLTYFFYLYLTQASKYLLTFNNM